MTTRKRKLQPKRKLYNISFLYCVDEDYFEDYFDTAMLTLVEAEKINDLLNAMEAEGQIQKPDNYLGDFCYAPGAPGTYAQAVEHLLSISDIQWGLNGLLDADKPLPAAAKGYKRRMYE